VQGDGSTPAANRPAIRRSGRIVMASGMIVWVVAAVAVTMACPPSRSPTAR
jgi:hypothetical protein